MGVPQPRYSLPPVDRAPRTTHGYALGVQVVTVGAVLKVDLIEGLGSAANDAAAVVEPVTVLGDDHLAQGHSPQGRLGDQGHGSRVTVGQEGQGQGPRGSGRPLTLWAAALCLGQVMDTT